MFDKLACDLLHNYVFSFHMSQLLMENISRDGTVEDT